MTRPDMDLWAASAGAVDEVALAGRRCFRRRGPCVDRGSDGARPGLPDGGPDVQGVLGRAAAVGTPRSVYQTRGLLIVQL